MTGSQPVEEYIDTAVEDGDAQGTPLLKIAEVTKRFGSLTAVDSLNFDLYEGGITALIGPNGAGKTVTYNLLTGKMAPSEGEIHFGGEDVTTMSAAGRTRVGLGRSFQIVNIFEELTVRQNLRVPIIARTGERFDPVRSVRKSALNEEVDEYLSLLDLETVADTRCSELPHGDQRRVDIGIALATEPRLLLLDEPTAGMTESDTRRMVDLIADLEAETVTSVLITEHDMNVVFSIAERVLVMDQGRIIVDGTPEVVKNSESVQSAYLGKQSFSRDESRQAPAGRTSGTDPLLALEGIHTYYGGSHILDGVYLELYEGEIVGLLGRNGAGKTTTLRSIVGEKPPRAGTIVFRGEEIQEASKHHISRLAVGYAPEERRIFENLSVEDNIEIVAAADSTWPKERLFDLFPKLEELRHRNGNQMSGGEQQMLTIARALATDPDLLLLDEPSEGLAPVIVDDLHDILSEIATTDLTVLMAEQNLDFVRSLADYNYILENGSIQWEGTQEELESDQDQIDRYLALTGM
jgi:ABC-type branched-subunit amino acid transport system ATPase component